MLSILTAADYKEIYAMLDEVSPLDIDCGQLCGAACCNAANSAFDDPDEEVGIFLLPGEDAVFSKTEPWLGWDTVDVEEYEFPDSWSGELPFLSCKADCHCDRVKRPIQCRTFPLQPHFDTDGKLCMIFDTNELLYKCPLIYERAKYKLNNSFIIATYDAWNRLITDPLIRDLVQLDSDNRREDGIAISVVYKPESA